MDEALREAERRFRGGDLAAFPEVLAHLARAGRRREVVQLVTDTPEGFQRCGAQELGRLVGTKTCAVGDGSPSPEPEDFDALVIGWELPPELGGGVLLETRQGRSSRSVAVVPQGRDLELHLETCRMPEIQATEIEASLQVKGTVQIDGVLAEITVEGEVFPPEWEAFFLRVAEAAGCALDRTYGVSDLS